MPAPLAQTATVDVSDATLGEIFRWLRETRGMVVLADTNGTADIGISLSASVSDRLDNGPIYQLLDRLRSHDDTERVRTETRRRSGSYECYKALVF